MGVSYGGTGHSFWVTNEHELEYIYHEFKKKERELKSFYHPDRLDTGDAEKYREIAAACELVQRQFEQHGVVKVSAAQLEERRELREARGKARRDFREEMIKAGKFVRQKRTKGPYRPRHALLASSDLLILNPDELLRRRKAREKAQWRKDETNRLKEQERNKKWRLAHPPTEEQRLVRLAYLRAYRKRPEVQVKDYRNQMAYRAANPEKVKQWKKNWAEKQKGKPRKKRPWREYKRCVKGTPAWERRKEYRKEHYEKNRDKINAQRRERVLANKIAARCKEPTLAAAA